MGLLMARRTKRLWTVEEKRSICLQTTAPGVSVAQVARRYALNANLVFKWLRDPRFAPDPDAAPAEGPCFLPVEIVERPVQEVAPAAGDARDPGGTIEIDVAGGHRMRISGRYDPEVLARLIRGLSG
jgi:transposase